MTVVSISEPVPAELASFDALNRRQLLCGDTSILRTIHADGQVRANWRALRVLVVAGQQECRVNARFELACRLGHNAYLASDGFAALRVAASRHPDVVLLDHGITLVESCQIARHLRFDFARKDVCVIAVTGRIDDVGRIKCTDAGIDVSLAEPLDPNVIETLLMLEWMRMNRSQET